MSFKLKYIVFKKQTKISKRIAIFLFIHVLLLSSFQQSYSQSNEYAEKLIADLCSEEFHGRGYDFGSDKLVCRYIIKELKKHKVKAFNKDYEQPFKINVNTLPGNNIVSIDGNSLDPAVDFITSSFSRTITGTYDIVILNAAIIDDSIKLRNFIRRDLSENALLIDTAGLKRTDFSEGYRLITEKNVLHAKVVIRIEDNNLMYTPSQFKSEFALISVRRDIISSNPKSISVDISSNLLKDYETNNIIGYIEGKSDSVVVLSAHYDHIGHMGLKTYFPGANDNSSGIAMLLNLAKILSKKKHLKYTIVFMFFSAEELGILGSKFYTEHPFFPLSRIKFLINLDMVGTGDEGIKVVNGSVFKKGVKSFFIYTLGKYKEYHNVNDKAGNLPLNEFEDLTSLLIDFINAI